MKLDFLYLIGGPLDGMYMPANPKLRGFPSEIAIYARQCGWVGYHDPEAGGTAKVDVYKIVQQRQDSFTRAPKGAVLHEMHYSGVLPQDQAQKIERMVREQRRREDE